MSYETPRHCGTMGLWGMSQSPSGHSMAKLDNYDFSSLKQLKDDPEQVTVCVF